MKILKLILLAFLYASFLLDSILPSLREIFYINNSQPQYQKALMNRIICEGITYHQLPILAEIPKFSKWCIFNVMFAIMPFSFTFIPNKPERKCES